jgi:peptide deformylase
MRKILTYPNPVLETPSEEVKFPLDGESKALINEMWDIVKKEGVGLAAPQVGVNKRICIVHLSQTEKGKQAKDIVLINPEITFKSEIENLMVEGCLSFPGEYWEIWRPANITVEYQDEKGKKRNLKGKDWLSRVIQHEVDHLNGQIFIKKGGKKLQEKDLAEKPVVD